jgi:hypothetical protein
VLLESPVREVLCPGCLVGCDTLAESDAELESDIEPESVGLALGMATVSAPLRMESRPRPDESRAPTRSGWAVVSMPAVPLYPDVSGRVSRVVDVSCAASRGAKAPTASAVIRAVK